MKELKAGLAYGSYLSKHSDHLEQAEAYDQAAYDARKPRRGLRPEWLSEKQPIAQVENASSDR